MTQGTVKELFEAPADGYLTVAILILPLVPDQIRAGTYSVEYEGAKIDVTLQVVDSAESDSIRKAGAGISLGTPGMNFSQLPFVALTDNRGRYPCIQAAVVVPYRVATWATDQHETGLASAAASTDNEEVQVVGPPPSREKVMALTILNRVLPSAAVGTPGIKLKNEDVSSVLLRYFAKGHARPIVQRLTVASYPAAYKDAVRDYYLAGIDQTEIKRLWSLALEGIKDTRIESEVDLRQVVLKVIDEVLVHHIENRRWIDAFWDGQRTIRHAGDSLTFPRTPKREPDIQPTLYVLFELVLTPLGIQVVRESDEGAGTLDFRFSFNTTERTLLCVGLELKLAHHGELEKGMRKQLPAYLRAIRSSTGIFAVMWFKDVKGKFFDQPKNRTKAEMLAWLEVTCSSAGEEHMMSIEPRCIDASIRPSASK